MRFCKDERCYFDLFGERYVCKVPDSMQSAKHPRCRIYSACRALLPLRLTRLPLSSSQLNKERRLAWASAMHESPAP